MKKNRPGLGRPRAFDPDEALEVAMRLFWAHGYEATSLAMLRDATGLTQPQIYGAFTDKENLFRLALDRYRAREVVFAKDALAAPVSTFEAMRLLLYAAAAFYADPAKPGGCLLVSAALAASPQAQPIALVLREHRATNEAAICARIRQGQVRGDVLQDANPLTLARYISSVMSGMSIEARDGVLVDGLAALADTALRALPMSADPGTTTRSRRRVTRSRY
jgi:AcrR family transcriptional regulator